MNITFIVLMAAVVAITVLAFRSVAKKEKEDAKSSLDIAPIKEEIKPIVKEPKVKPIVKEPKVKKQPAKKKQVSSGSGSGSGSGAGKATIGGAGKPAKKSSGSGSGKK
jgi:hypothetical protein